MLHYVHLIQYSILYMTHYTPHSVPHKLDALHSTLSTLHAPHLTLHTLHSTVHTRFAAFAAGTARRELEPDSRQIPHKVTLHTSNTTRFAYAIVTAVQWGVDLHRPVTILAPRFAAGTCFDKPGCHRGIPRVYTSYHKTLVEQQGNVIYHLWYLCVYI